MADRPEGMYVGELIDAAAHSRTGEPVAIDPGDLTTHGVIVGMTGSGKTGLGVVLIEEALRAGVATLVLDPKGDMTNLLLQFPELRPGDFEPWVPQGQSAEEVATAWAKGLGEWGLGGADIATVRDGHRATVYTPGSTAGVPLNLFGSLAPPSTTDAEARHDEVESLVQSLLGLVGVTSDPLSGREHVLMANVVEAAWAAGESLDLPTLLTRIQTPPMRKLGVIDVEQFFPSADRTALVMKLNGLLASPSYAAWGQGTPLDIPTLLWDGQGRPSNAVVYLAHLSEEERQMVVTRVLSKLISWMRGQQGSTSLRVLVYMDEVYGYVPPTAVPPSKKPILTLFKQARAFGVGVVLATQNPVDLDYKAISNAGTWMVGRLQTANDKQRLLEGMTSAAGDVDLAAADATISGLGKREFLLRRAGRNTPSTFGVRWAMSYLAGPLAKEQVSRLPGMTESAAVVPPVTAAAPGPTDPAPTSPPVAAASPTLVPPTLDPPAATPLADDESPAMPKVADGVLVRTLDPAAGWASQVGAVPGGRRLQAALAVRCALTFDDTKAQLHETEIWEAILFPLPDQPGAADFTAVDYDDRDLLTDQPAGSVFVLPTAPVATKGYFTTLQSVLKDRLVGEQSSEIQRNAALKLFSRPGETAEEFAQRCRDAADAAADAEADKVRQRLEAKISRLQSLIAESQLRAQQAAQQASTSRTQEVISGAGSVLGALFGGRRSASSIAGAFGRGASGRARTQRVEDRAEAAAARVADKQEDLDALEAQLADEIADIAAKWQDDAAAIETVQIPLEKGDIAVQQVALVWVPTG